MGRSEISGHSMRGSLKGARGLTKIVVSQNRGPKYRLKYNIILIMGTAEKV